MAGVRASGRGEEGTPFRRLWATIRQVRKQQVAGFLTGILLTWLVLLSLFSLLFSQREHFTTYITAGSGPRYIVKTGWTDATWRNLENGEVHLEHLGDGSTSLESLGLASLSLLVVSVALGLLYVVICVCGKAGQHMAWLALPLGCGLLGVLGAYYGVMASYMKIHDDATGASYVHPDRCMVSGLTAGLLWIAVGSISLWIPVSEPPEAAAPAPTKGKARGHGSAVSIVVAAGHGGHPLAPLQPAAHAPKDRDLELGTVNDSKGLPASTDQHASFPASCVRQASISQTSLVSIGNPNSMGTWLGSARSSRVAIEGMLATTRDYDMRSSMERPTTPLFAADLSMDASESDWTSHVASSQVPSQYHLVNPSEDIDLQFSRMGELRVCSSPPHKSLFTSELGMRRFLFASTSRHSSPQHLGSTGARARGQSVVSASLDNQLLPKPLDAEGDSPLRLSLGKLSKTVAQARFGGVDQGGGAQAGEGPEEEDVELGPDTARCDSGWFAELTRKLGGPQEVDTQAEEARDARLESGSDATSSGATASLSGRPRSTAGLPAESHLATGDLTMSDMCESVRARSFLGSLLASWTESAMEEQMRPSMVSGQSTSKAALEAEPGPEEPHACLQLQGAKSSDALPDISDGTSIEDVHADSVGPLPCAAPRQLPADKLLPAGPPKPPLKGVCSAETEQAGGGGHPKATDSAVQAILRSFEAGSSRSPNKNSLRSSQSSLLGPSTALGTSMEHCIWRAHPAGEQGAQSGPDLSHGPGVDQADSCPGSPQLAPTSVAARARAFEGMCREAQTSETMVGRRSGAGLDSFRARSSTPDFHRTGRHARGTSTPGPRPPGPWQSSTPPAPSAQVPAHSPAMPPPETTASGSPAPPYGQSLTEARHPDADLSQRNTVSPDLRDYKTSKQLLFRTAHERVPDGPGGGGHKVLTAADTLRLWELTHASREAVQSRSQRGPIASCTGQAPSFPTITGHLAPELHAPLAAEMLDNCASRGSSSDEAKALPSSSKMAVSQAVLGESLPAAKCAPGSLAASPAAEARNPAGVDAPLFSVALSTETLLDSQAQPCSAAWDLHVASNLVVLHNNAAALESRGDEDEDITVMISRSDRAHSPPHMTPAPRLLADADGQAGNGRISNPAGALSENVPPQRAVEGFDESSSPGRGAASGHMHGGTSQAGAGEGKRSIPLKAISGVRGPSSPVRALAKATKDVRAVLETRQRNVTAEVAASLFKGERLLANSGKPKAEGGSMRKTPESSRQSSRASSATRARGQSDGRCPPPDASRWR